MKTKTIGRILQKKFGALLASLDPFPELRKLVKENAVITGGSIASMLRGEKVNDFDIYFRTMETALAVATHYVDQFVKAAAQKHKDGGSIDIAVQVKGEVLPRVHIMVKSAGIASEKGTDTYEYFESAPEDRGLDFVDQTFEATEKDTPEETDFRPIFISSNAIMLSGKVQLIVRFYGEPEDIHSTFDFVHCTNYWRSDTGQVTVNERALEALLTKELIYVGSKYPICSIVRVRKFIARGWSINAGQLLKMILQIKELDLFDRNVLEEQLIGVDSAYFSQLIHAMKDLAPEKLNSVYLAAIIDRIF